MKCPGVVPNIVFLIFFPEMVFFAKLPDFLGEINSFSLIFSFRANLRQNVIEEKRFVGKIYIF